MQQLANNVLEGGGGSYIYAYCCTVQYIRAHCQKNVMAINDNNRDFTRCHAKSLMKIWGTGFTKRPFFKRQVTEMTKYFSFVLTTIFSNIS